MFESIAQRAATLPAAMGCVCWLCVCALRQDAHAQSSDLTARETANALVGQAADDAVRAGEAAGVVNLNTASAEELERLPGIGPTRATAILALRARLGRFARLEQLLRVKGIGRATFRKLRPLLSLTGPTTLPGRTHRRPRS